MRRFDAGLAFAREQLDLLPRDYHERTLAGLMAVLAWRERDARPHSYRAAAYARRLGEALGVVDGELDVLERGALLHDLGKVGISDRILRKPGQLDEAEWDQMRWHPALGHGLLSDFEFLTEPRTIVLQHHERWDGSGYPSGLQGETIHLGARITAVVDALDAMLSPRPYRAAMPFDSAWRELQRCAGTQFDPAVVEAFVAVGYDTWQRTIEGQRSEEHLAVV